MINATYFPTPFIVPAESVDYVELQHDLPSADFWAVQFFASSIIEQMSVVVRDALRFPKSSIDTSIPYRLIAFRVRNGGLDDGLWWVDDYIYDEDQVNIEFTNNAPDEGDGELKTFSGTVEVADQPASRLIVATALDSDSPRQLASTVSDSNGQYTLEWTGYSGKMMITVVDDYGAAHNQGDARGVGERVHPSSGHTGYVYEVSESGTLGTEPSWPTADGEVVVSGDVRMISKPYYRPAAAGVFKV